MKRRSGTAGQLAVEYLDPRSLHPDPQNPRRMTEIAYAKLQRGMRDLTDIAAGGLVDPIIARREDRLVIGGHQRLRAALEDGLDAVPVILLRGVSDDRAAALNVLLNNPGVQGEWDPRP